MTDFQKNYENMLNIYMAIGTNGLITSEPQCGVLAGLEDQN